MRLYEGYIGKPKISHIALIVTDLDKARKFYTETLNLEEVERPRFYIQGIWYSIGDVEVNSAGVKQFFFYDPDRKMLEINNELGKDG